MPHWEAYFTCNARLYAQKKITRMYILSDTTTFFSLSLSLFLSPLPFSRIAIKILDT